MGVIITNMSQNRELSLPELPIVKTGKSQPPKAKEKD